MPSDYLQQLFDINATSATWKHFIARYLQLQLANPNISTVVYGTTAGTATEGNDGRIATIGSGAINTATGVIQTQPETLEVHSLDRGGLADLKVFSVLFNDDQDTGHYGSLSLGDLTADRGYYMPDATGTVALTTQATDIEITDHNAGFILRAANGNRYRLHVGNAGGLSTTLIP